MVKPLQMNVEICASVVTGFEKIAAEEISLISTVRNVKWERGNVRFRIDLKSSPEILKLRSVDNLYVVFYEKSVVSLTNLDKETALRTIQNQIVFCDWESAIETYQLIRGKTINGGSELHVQRIKEFASNGIRLEVNEISPKFRVTCKRCGEKEIHKFSSMEAASKFGADINNAFGWKCSVHDFDIEVVLRIEKDNITVMMALNDESLFKRNISAYGPTTMRSTICHCMLRLADIKSGEIVVDPMCGGGSIPIEGSISWKNSFFFGGDNHELALERCRENLNANSSIKNCEFFTWDATNLPFQNNSINSIVTDLPFGRKIGSRMDNRLLYPLLLEEWKRVLKIGGRLVVMTHDKRSLENSLLKDRSSWQKKSFHIVNMGGLQCLCLCLLNTKSS
uniref:THUMP domain-containing protein n=2 Tax=Caenorhabditis tropicalis TaxID=1561998 RepID=A0A1I7T511_9PELO